MSSPSQLSSDSLRQQRSVPISNDEDKNFMDGVAEQTRKGGLPLELSEVDDIYRNVSDDQANFDRLSEISNTDGIISEGELSESSSKQSGGLHTALTENELKKKRPISIETESDLEEGVSSLRATTPTDQSVGESQVSSARAAAAESANRFKTLRSAPVAVTQADASQDGLNSLIDELENTIQGASKEITGKMDGLLSKLDDLERRLR
ncbi:hypothetical protein V1511DRAFT_100688 [Dipodascopsis uninucleata]